METEPKYKRILLKISGEALAGEQKTGLASRQAELSRQLHAQYANGLSPWAALLVGVRIGAGSCWFGAIPSGSRMPYISRWPAWYRVRIEVEVVPAR